MSILGSPVGVPIRPFGTPGTGFVVTAPFGVVDKFHPANNPDGTHGHQGIDIGDGTIGKPFVAMEDGVVDAILTAPNGARIVRYALDKHPGWQAGIAHMDTFEVKLGQRVLRGQMIGHIGRSGTTAAHGHVGLKINGVEVDWWPYYIGEDTELDSSFAPKPNKTVTVTKGARHRTAPSLDAATIAIASDPGGPLGFPLLGTVVGAVVNGNSIWYAYWRPETSKVYYLHTSTCGPETPWQQTTGHSDAELAAARDQAATDAANAVSMAAATKAAQFGTKKT